MRNGFKNVHYNRRNVTDHLFDRLRDIQHKFGYLPGAQMQSLSNSAGIPLSQIHAVADFYPHFHLAPPPKVMARVCSDMSCHLRGADALRAALIQRFRATGDRDVSIQNTSCLGQCDGAPAMSVNDRIHRDVNAAQAEALIVAGLGGAAVEMPPEAIERGLAADPYRDSPCYGALRELLETGDVAGVIAKLKSSGLVGLGGAGFPTGVKWEAVRNAPGDEKYVVCNADESEPGTIKDRFILHHLPHLVIEGMILAGIVTGARRGILYIRHEYEAQEKILDEEIHRCRREGLIGRDILGSGKTFELELFVSPGGYICGEETALIEAIEGKRAEPRNKPPFPVTHGLFHKPTVLNNVETLANVPQILRGAGGWKFAGISGDVCRPGIYCVKMGTPLSEVLFHHAGGVRAGKKLKAFAPSGPSSGYLPATLVDTPLDFKAMAAVGSMLGSAAIVICAEGRCMVDMALNAVTFFRNESCGKCVPCRSGTQKMTDILAAWTHGLGAADDLKLLDDLSEAMKLASICGLGQFAHQPLTSVLTHFRDEVEAHVIAHRCPENVCPMEPRA
jgi:formate dehydrogenase beta subunit